MGLDFEFYEEPSGPRDSGAAAAGVDATAVLEDTAIIRIGVFHREGYCI